MRFLKYIFCALLFVTASVADTININWINDDETYAQTTCEIGGDIILPESPTKRGYTFKGWVAEYTRLEYIESTGTQYINTGFTWETSTKIDFTIERIGDNAGQEAGTSRANVWFGANGSAGNENMLGWGAAGNSNYFRGGISRSYYALPLNTKTNITFDYTKGAIKLLVNGEQDGYGSTRDTVITSKILLGGVVDIEASILLCLERFYGGVKLWNGDSLVANFIPTKRNSDSAIGMYDTVSGQFFTNAGTGEFIAGPVAENQYFYE